MITYIQKYNKCKNKLLISWKSIIKKKEFYDLLQNTANNTP